jgi:hypothetical protein
LRQTGSASLSRLIFGLVQADVLLARIGALPVGDELRAHVGEMLRAITTGA